MAKENKSITDIIEEVKEDICSNYCKHPEKYEPDEWDNVFEEVCKDCPLDRL